MTWKFFVLVIVFLAGIAIGYYFGTDHGWESAVRALGS